jgi:hypothetical protein
VIWQGSRLLAFNFQLKTVFILPSAVCLLPILDLRPAKHQRKLNRLAGFFIACPMSFMEACFKDPLPGGVGVGLKFPGRGGFTQTNTNPIENQCLKHFIPQSATFGPPGLQRCAVDLYHSMYGSPGDHLTTKTKTVNSKLT